jgi:tripartite-type tricarboxylate transporter receptor subunit TctC
MVFEITYVDPAIATQAFQNLRQRPYVALAGIEGAAGNIATEYVSKSKPDGYTIFIAPTSSYLGASPSLFKKLAFDPIDDFEHVAPLLKNTWILAVAGDSPHKTAAELTAYLKEQGDKASYGSLANTGLVSTELYKANFGLKTVEVTEAPLLITVPAAAMDDALVRLTRA